MKRPIVYVGFGVILSLIFAISFQTAAFWAAAVCFAFVIFYTIFEEKLPDLDIPRICAAAMGTAMVFYLGAVAFYAEPLVNDLDEQNVIFSGTIVSEPYTEKGNTHFIVETEKINDEKRKVKIYITTSLVLSADIYDRIDGNAKLNALFDSGYGYESYYAARHVFLSAYINPYYGSSYSVKENEHRPVRAVFSDIRKEISYRLKKYMPEDEAAVCEAILTGSRTELRDEIYTPFKDLGVSHVLVVSGMHLSIAASLILRLTSIIPRKGKYRRFICAAVLIIRVLPVTGFAALTGFGFSVTRAWIMTVIMMTASSFNESRDESEHVVRRKIRINGYDALGAAALVLCCDPFCAGDVGMLWSFSCTLAIMLFEPRFEKYMRKVFSVGSAFGKAASVTLAVSLSAFLGSIPFVVFFTGSVSPYTIIVNFLVVPLAEIIMTTGAFGVIVSFLGFEALNRVVMMFPCFVTKIMIFVTNSFEKLPFSSVSTTHTFVYFWLAFTIVTCLIYIVLRRIELGKINNYPFGRDEREDVLDYFFIKFKLIGKRLALISAAVFLIGFIMDTAINYGKITVSVLDIGDGLTVTVKKGKSVLVLDSYGEKYQYSSIKNELDEADEIKCIVDITPDNSVFNYNKRICRDYDIGRILVCNDEMYDEKYCYQRYLGKEVTLMTELYSLRFFGDQELLMKNEEEKGSWQYLRLNGAEILICSSQTDFSELPQDFRNADIVVMSDRPENFTYSMDAKIIVSGYGEKCETTMSQLSEQGYTVGSTNGEGRIDITISKDGILSFKREYTGGVTRYADD